MVSSDDLLPVAEGALWSRECLRRSTLRKMGISPLISRFDGVGSKPATRFSSPASDAEPQQKSAPTADTLEKPADQFRALVRDGNDSTTARSSVAEEPTPAKSSVQPAGATDGTFATVTPFSLVMVTSADILWIEVLEDQFLKKEQLKLVAAMARAVRGADLQCAHQQFDWPPAHQSALSAAEGGMPEILSGFIKRRTTEHATQHIVLLGPCDCLPDTGLPLLEIPSSLNMLRDGSLKQVAWDALKRFKACA